MSKTYKKIKIIYHKTMIWQIVLLFIIFILIIPIPIKFKILFNILKLSGEIQVNIFKFIYYMIRILFRI